MTAWRAVLLLLVVVVPGAAADTVDDAWSALAAGGHVAVIRHANAPPGHGGDPPGMRIDDCTTQRNLDDRGREQGRALGEAFRRRGVPVGRVVSSPMCRCVDTAELMAVGPVERSTTLLPDPGQTPGPRFRQLKDLVEGWRGPGTLVLVTHGFAMRPLVGFIPEQAGVVVVKPDPGNPRGGAVLGRLPPP